MDEKIQELSGSKITPEASKKSPVTRVIYILVFTFGILIAKALFSFLDSKFLVSKSVSTPTSQEITSLETKKAPLPAVTAPDASPVVFLPQEAIKPIAPIEKNPLPKLILGGILAGDASGWAIIDDKIVKAGDTVKGATVIGISSGRVDLEFEGEPFSLLVS